MPVEILSEKNKEALTLCDRGIEILETNNDQQTAHKLFTQAFEMFPSNPKINSWVGYTYGTLENKVTLGLKHCKKAVDEGEPDAMFYRNIGKLYILKGNKRAAVGSFARGLQIENNNRAILKEWKQLGFRRKPVIPFLSRDNFINKILGKLTWKLKKRP